MPGIPPNSVKSVNAYKTEQARSGQSEADATFPGTQMDTPGNKEVLAEM
jgi:hypothetical protein